MSTARRAHPPLQNGAGGHDGDDEREEEDGDEGELEGEAEGEEGEEEEEEEPRLKYQRLGGSVPAILSTDAAASVAVADRMVALGTHNGTLHILDFQGNQVLPPLATTGRSLSLSPFGIGRLGFVVVVGNGWMGGTWRGVNRDRGIAVPLDSACCWPLRC
jgi:hypothetical protein